MESLTLISLEEALYIFQRLFQLILVLLVLRIPHHQYVLQFGSKRAYGALFQKSGRILAQQLISEQEQLSLPFDKSPLQQ